MTDHRKESCPYPGRIDREPTLSVRHVPVPWRQVGHQVVVARPSDGAPLVLAPTAAMIWAHLAEWCTRDQLAAHLGDRYPAVDSADREQTLTQVLDHLIREGLVEVAAH